MREWARAAAKSGVALAQAAGYCRDEPQRCRLDRRLRLARLYWPSLKAAWRGQGRSSGDAWTLAATVGFIQLMAVANVFIALDSSPEPSMLNVAGVVGAASILYGLALRFTVLSPVFETRGSERLALCGPGEAFEGYLDRSAAERCAAQALEMRLCLRSPPAGSRARSRRSPRL